MKIVPTRLHDVNQYKNVQVEEIGPVQVHSGGPT